MEIISDEANAINRMEVETLKRSMRDPRAPPIPKAFHNGSFLAWYPRHFAYVALY
jgi:hypothetical protein